MRLQLQGNVEKLEANKIQKSKIEGTLNDEGKTKKQRSSVSQPIRVKFARPETEAQKRRRESSSLHKQRQFESDPWVPLEVHKEPPAKFFKREIERALASNGHQQTIGHKMDTVNVASSEPPQIMRSIKKEVSSQDS